MNSGILTVMQLNLRNLSLPYFQTASLFVINFFVFATQAIMVMRGVNMSDTVGLGMGWIFSFLIPLAALYIPTNNFRRIINLGGKRRDYFWGSLVTYAVLACAASLIGVIVHYAEDLIATSIDPFSNIVALSDVFGWSAHNPIVAFFQQLAFLFLLATFVHTLATMRNKWYGWVTYITLFTVVLVFTNTMSLQSKIAWFFNLLTSHDNALLQIVSCVVLAMVIYMFSKPVIARTTT